MQRRRLTPDSRCSRNRRGRGLVRLPAVAAVAVAGTLAPVGALAERVDLPLREITLYRSGVGFFERAATVRGDATAELTFDADKINDILKSLVLLDPDGGAGTTVRYDANEPAAKRLAGFAIDVTRVTGTASLLKQLQGVPVAIDTITQPLNGTVLSVEDRMTAVTTDGAVGHYKEPYVTVVTPRGVRSAAVSRITNLEIKDDRLAEELGKALEVLAESRGDQRRSVELRFSGSDSARRVTAAYTHEMPVWKTSYRLVLDGDDPSDLSATLQAWAIVENTTDEDWENVRLSLAAGRPVGFTMNLYDPLFVPRPELAVPVELAFSAREYSDAVGDELRRFPDPGVARLRANDMERERAISTRAARGGGGSSPFEAFEDVPELDLSSILASQASGADVGGQFIYTVDAPVSVDRQSSAMLPIVSAGVEARRLSIWDARDGSTHPMRGIEFTNDSGSHLLPGPIAVFDANAFAGDARIGHTTRGQERLLSYAADLDVSVDAESEGKNRVTRVRITDGLVIRTYADERSTAYEWSNKDRVNPRTLVIQHPRSAGWDVTASVDPEVTGTHLRFEIDLPAETAGRFEVKEQRVRRTRLALLEHSLDTLLAYQRDGVASAAVIEAFRRGAELQAQLERARERIRSTEERRREITAEQRRIRENMEAIERDTRLYERYLTKLGEQETSLETIARNLETQRREAKQREDALNAYLRGLNVS